MSGRCWPVVTIGGYTGLEWEVTTRERHGGVSHLAPLTVVHVWSSGLGPALPRQRRGFDSRYVLARYESVGTMRPSHGRGAGSIPAYRMDLPVGGAGR